jgi:CRISPR-associated protein (TIGR02710 family)
MPEHILLICTVGGSPEPIVASLKNWRPSRVLFIPSPQTKAEVETKILPLAQKEGFALNVGAYDFVVVPDSQDFAACVRKMREMAPEVAKWLARGPAYGVIIDYTGGTKSMSAALALQAHPWGCQFAYVGGTERTKNEVGVVVSGKEQILHVQNPWDASGYQAVEDALTLFDQAAYGAAAKLLQRALIKVQDPVRKRELSTLKTLAEAYDAWDRFEHKDAARLLGEVLKNENDLRSLFGSDRTEDLRTLVGRHRAYLADLLADAGPTWARVIDLLANAKRRMDEQRFDDAVARLYRGIEAMAQARLRVAYGIADTGKVALELLPDVLRASKAASATANTVWLALQDAYILLQAHADDLGRRFHDCRLDDREKSTLQARNRSILAHGFDPVSQKDYRNLWRDALKLAEVTEADLPTFPRLASTC